MNQEISALKGTNGEDWFRSVMKKMMPDAAGTRYDKTWLPGDNETVNYSWNFTNVFDPDSIHVVAFIQDGTTKEIYQAGGNNYNCSGGKIKKIGEA